MSRMPKERAEKLRRLAHLMNSRNDGSLPVTDKLLRCFELMISPGEADFLLLIDSRRLTVRELEELSGLPGPEFDPFLARLLQKGLLWSYTETGEERHFEVAPIMVGWFEVSLADGMESALQREFARRFDDYISSMKSFNIFPIRNLLNMRKRRYGRTTSRIVAAGQSPAPLQGRLLQVDKKIDPLHSNVLLTHSVQELVDRFGSKQEISVLHCFCRQWRKMVGEECRFKLPAQACLALGSLAKHAVEAGIAEPISKAEAFELIESVQKLGAVHQVFHERENLEQPEFAICNCCWDCCGVLGSYNRAILPLRFKSHYLAQPDGAQCTGCGRCEKFCPVGAIRLEGGRSRVTREMCIGCGQCAIQCPEQAIDLEPVERTVFLPMLKKSHARIG